MAGMSEHAITQAPSKRLERSSDRILAGVAGGPGTDSDVPPAVFLLGFVVRPVTGGAGILVYTAAALVIPAADKEKSIAEEVLAERREHPVRLIALGLI